EGQRHVDSWPRWSARPHRWSRGSAVGRRRGKIAGRWNMALDIASRTAPSPERPRRVTILGSTGSVGQSTVDLIEREPGRFRVEALVAGNSVESLADQARRLHARLAVVANPNRYLDLKEALAGTGIEAAAGPDAVVDAAERPAEWVMAAIVGFAGLQST